MVFWASKHWVQGNITIEIDAENTRLNHRIFCGHHLALAGNIHHNHRM